MKTIEILVGIPCSGKSTYTEKQYVSNQGTFFVNRDDIREFFKLNNYTKESENKVTDIFDRNVYRILNCEFCNIIILDNTHCKEKYIDEIIKKYSIEHNIEIKFFDTPLYKAHYRNIIRYFKTGKWIPIKIMNNMYKNYNKINKQKYAKYMVY